MHEIIERKVRLTCWSTTPELATLVSVQVPKLLATELTHNSHPPIDVDMEEILRIFNTSVFASIRTARAVIPLMASRKRGTIANVGSMGGLM